MHIYANLALLSLLLAPASGFVTTPSCAAAGALIGRRGVLRSSRCLQARGLPSFEWHVSPLVTRAAVVPKAPLPSPSTILRDSPTGRSRYRTTTTPQAARMGSYRTFAPKAPYVQPTSSRPVPNPRTRDDVRNHFGGPPTFDPRRGPDQPGITSLLDRGSSCGGKPCNPGAIKKAGDIGSQHSDRPEHLSPY